MSKYRKRPVVIDAYRLDDRPDNVEPDWLERAVVDNVVVMYVDHTDVHTTEGTMRADLGDWIIRGVKGELYPCKPDVFEATYDEVEED